MQASQQYFSTKNEVFNEIASLKWGSSLLLLDETHFESILFLDALLQKSLSPAKMHIVSYQDTGATLETMKLDLEKYTSLQEISIIINRLREQIGPCGIIIHHYLPHILTREPEETVLRMLEFWTTKTTEKNLIEFYTLPQGTFPTMEKKVSAFMTGEITIRFTATPERQLTFIIKRACKPQYHFASFPFMVKDGRLLIKWGEAFTDQLPLEETKEIKRRINYMKENLTSLKLVRGVTAPENLKPYEYWLLTQLMGKRLTDIQLIFPDKIDEILAVIARLNIRNIMAFEKVDKREMPPPPKSLKFRSKIGLRLPLWLSVRRLHKDRHYVVTDAYRAFRRSVETFMKYSLGAEKAAEQLADLESTFQEMPARITALERLRNNKEDARVKFDLKYLPQCISLTIHSGFQIKPKVIPRSRGAYEIVVKDCDLCADQKTDKPACQQVSAMVRGMCGVCFKERFVCEEVRCKARGDDACVFVLERA